MTALAPVAVADLESLALRVRAHAVRMATDGGCFLGASLSCADLIVYLYTRFLRIDPARPDDPARDVLLLSKGHDVPALYGTLAELGFFPRERLTHHLRPDDHLYWHPNRAIPGVEFHSGSLGHLLAVGAGIATDARLRGADTRVVVILGDGELNEGSVWETALVAAAHRLDNLIAIVDRNEFQANLRTEDLIPLEPLTHKWAAFGWNVDTTDGHDFHALESTFRAMRADAGRPTAIIARTVRGKGLPSIEGRADRWFCNVSAAEVEALLAELAGAGRAELTAAPMMVR
ncbi:MAG TPA: 1-deoxy-D-xylulose-5-phosphate synthase N-terminal domain-containing protein [Gemmatimonadaceae bacterium]|nr:1-deoxy-D-xylulose-5-phosphate synthase N-terminal domain-containing protein [Gemmatimonadaceae bacterium]